MISTRIRTVQLGIIITALLVFLRLFYWQVVRGQELSGKAITQRSTTATLNAKRGDILASDLSPLASTQATYLLYAYKPQVTKSFGEIIEALTPIITSVAPPASESSPTVDKKDYDQETKEYLTQRLNIDKSWVSLKSYLTIEQKEKIEGLDIDGLGFQEQMIRYYPEASMSAHLLGFVGNDINGEPKGYFGLEGFYERQLQGRAGLMKQENDAAGNPILIGQFANYQSKNGRNLLTTINRGFQYHVEKLLSEGLAKYGASEGTVIVMKPQTGAILAMASLPRYDPRHFYLYPPTSYKNPSVANLFEPGSVFKPLVMAAAIDAGSIKPETICDQTCDKPVTIGTYTVRTWNDKYYPGTSMTEVLVHSDNTGMVFTARQLGAPKFQEYLEKFNLGNQTGIDQQEEVTANLRPAKDWKEIDLATISFGQGIAVTPIQMLTAINVIANQGQLVAPYIVDSIKENDSFIPIKRPIPKKVVSKETANLVTQMMVEAASQGDAKWAAPAGVKIAGKTGTAQIPVQGHYDEEKTIASFVGFAPAENPKFAMLVTLREPQSSPWGSETAAPLWFAIAKQLLLLD